MKRLKRPESSPVRIKPYTLILALMWSAVITASLTWNVYQTRQGTLDVARVQVRASFMKDVIYRRWNAGHGGVYVPVTEKTPPNPYLEVSERDITTHSGIALTMINPAYMTRQVHELAEEEYGIRGHITSLNPIRSANAPDPWEIQALGSIQHGAKEVTSVEKVKGSAYMRLIQPLITEEGCLKCHAAQGYKIGDIQGGISVSAPMSPLWAIERSHILILSLGHGLLYLVGLVGLGLGASRLSKQVVERKKAEEALQKRTHDFGERVKELDCMYGISTLIETPNITLEKIIQGIVDLIPFSWQYPKITYAQITLGENKFQTVNFKKTKLNQKSVINVYGKPEGSVEVCYLDERPESDEDSFLKEERQLIDAIAQRLGRNIERQRAEKALRKSEEKLRNLSSHLMTAQEQERKRIAMDLHDDLGQALAVLKLQLRSIQNKLPSGQEEVICDCESANEYLNQTIEKMRRLSNGLTPFHLDDLGLTISLQSLADDFTQHSHIKISFDMANIDKLFSPVTEIIIYRIFQEIFTNNEKHAQADHVKIEVKKRRDSVSFQIEDNGKGFDIKKIELKCPTERGLGLTSMDERVRMLSGRLEIQSQLNEGTKINFTIPFEKAGSIS